MFFVAIIFQFVCVLFGFYILGKISPVTFLTGFTYVAHIFLCLYLAAWILEVIHHWFFKSTVSPKNKAVLITGCDTGFGNSFAELLHAKGFKVYACCLDPSSHGAQQLTAKCSKSLEIIRLDVTDEKSIQIAKNFLVDNLGNSELWAVVNNAGVLKGFGVELCSMKDFEDCMQVNTLGPVRVARAFLPLLRKSKGRLVNISSVSGRTASPFLGPYTMSKHAVAAFSDVLRYELREFGIRVISVEPEIFCTTMTSNDYLSKHLDAIIEDVSDEIKAEYGGNYIEWAKHYILLVISRCASPKIQLVLDAMEAAVCLEHPSDVYKPCRNVLTRLIFFLSVRVPDICKDIYFFMIFQGYRFLTLKSGLSLLKKL